MRYFRKLALLFSAVIIVFGILLMSSCGTSDDPTPEASNDNIVGVWSASNIIKTTDSSGTATEQNLFGEMTFDANKTGKMQFGSFDENNFDWKSDESTITITNKDGVQVFQRTTNNKDDQVITREEKVDELTTVITVTLTRK